MRRTIGIISGLCLSSVTLAERAQRTGIPAASGTRCAAGTRHRAPVAPAASTAGYGGYDSRHPTAPPQQRQYGGAPPPRGGAPGAGGAPPRTGAPPPALRPAPAPAPTAPAPATPFTAAAALSRSAGSRAPAAPGRGAGAKRPRTRRRTTQHARVTVASPSISRTRWMARPACFAPTRRTRAPSARSGFRSSRATSRGSSSFVRPVRCAYRWPPSSANDSGDARRRARRHQRDAASRFSRRTWRCTRRASSNNRGNPRLLQVLGDTNFGLKAFMPWEPDSIFTAGGSAEVWFLNGTGRGRHRQRERRASRAGDARPEQPHEEGRSHSRCART